MSERPKDPEEWQQGEKAWMANKHEEARKLFARAIEAVSGMPSHLPASFYLTQWAYLEATSGDRRRFEDLYARAFEGEPDAPFIRLSYARVLWTEFKDSQACARAVGEVEALLRSDRWRREGDLTLRAYEQKIETLRAWMRGEPGGLWP
jgi:hypothetical protein